MFDFPAMALVTGIGGPVDALGNGKAIAMLLWQGAMIEGTDIDERLEPIRLRPFAMLGGQRASCVNATDQTGVEGWVKACAAKHGGLIFCNNVGQSEPGGPYRWMQPHGRHRLP